MYKWQGLGILTRSRQEILVKPKLLIPTMVPPGLFPKTLGDFLHADAGLDPCRGIDVLNAKVTHNPLLVFHYWDVNEEGRGGGGWWWLSSIGQHGNIWLSLVVLCQDTHLYGNEGGHFKCTNRSWRARMVNMHFLKMAGLKPARPHSMLSFNMKD